MLFRSVSQSRYFTTKKIKADATRKKKRGDELPSVSTLTQTQETKIENIEAQ